MCISVQDVLRLSVRFAVLSVVLGFIMIGCAPLESNVSGQGADLEPLVPNTGRLNGFLTLEQVEGPVLRMQVADIEVLSDDLWLPFVDGPLTLDSADIAEGQQFLGAKALPPGRYERMRLTVTGAEMQALDGSYVPVLQEPVRVEVALPMDSELEIGDSKCVLLNWNLQNSLNAQNLLTPALTALETVQQLPVDLVFVSCPEIDTIFVIRPDKNWVVDSFGLEGRPTSLAPNTNLSNAWLYVLTPREKKVKLVDLESYRVLDFFPTPLNDEPTFMTISSDGRAAFLLDEKSGYASRMDLRTGQIVARTYLGNRPSFALMLEQTNLLAVSLSLSQQVVLLDPETLMLKSRITTGSSPRGLASAFDHLYIAEAGDDMVSVVDLVGTGGSSRFAVGFAPHSVQETDNQIFVSNHLSGSLSVLLPGQLNVVQEVRDLGRPGEMTYDAIYRRLYVTDTEAASLSVIDVNTNQLIGKIGLGAIPLDLVWVR